MPTTYRNGGSCFLWILRVGVGISISGLQVSIGRDFTWCLCTPHIFLGWGMEGAVIYFIGTFQRGSWYNSASFALPSLWNFCGQLLLMC